MAFPPVVPIFRKALPGLALAACAAMSGCAHDLALQGAPAPAASGPASPGDAATPPASTPSVDQHPQHVWAIVSVARGQGRPVSVAHWRGQVQQWGQLLVGDDSINAVTAQIVATKAPSVTITGCGSTAVGAAGRLPASQAALVQAVGAAFCGRNTLVTFTPHGRQTVMRAAGYTFVLVPSHLRTR